MTQLAYFKPSRETDLLQSMEAVLAQNVLWQTLHQQRLLHDILRLMLRGVAQQLQVAHWYAQDEPSQQHHLALGWLALLLAQEFDLAPEQTRLGFEYCIMHAPLQHPSLLTEPSLDSSHAVVIALASCCADMYRLTNSSTCHWPLEPEIVLLLKGQHPSRWLDKLQTLGALMPTDMIHLQAHLPLNGLTGQQITEHTERYLQKLQALQKLQTIAKQTVLHQKSAIRAALLAKLSILGQSWQQSNIIGEGTTQHNEAITDVSVRLALNSNQARWLNCIAEADYQCALLWRLIEQQQFTQLFTPDELILLDQTLDFGAFES